MRVMYPTLRNVLAAGAAVLAVVVAAPAQAVTVVGAASITIKSALPDFLQVAELLAFDFDDDNVALAANGGVATALSQFFPEEAPEGGPNEAIDGVYPANYDYTHNPAIGGVYHSGGAGANEFLTVTFAAPTTLSKIEIWGRLDCCAGRDLYNVTVQNAAGATIWSGQLDATAGQGASVSFDEPSNTAVPEPGAWALMILGFGGAGAMLRRRARGGRALAA